MRRPAESGGEVREATAADSVGAGSQRLDFHSSVEASVAHKEVHYPDSFRASLGARGGDCAPSGSAQPQRASSEVIPFLGWPHPGKQAG